MALTDMDMGAEHTKKTNEDHTITLEMIKNDFKEDFLDEIEDCNKYCDMAMAAEEMGHTKLASGLYEMAHDEYTHAHFIHDNLVDWGCEIPEKEMLKWHELKERIHRKFR
jgi:rubrerythrin